MIEPERRFVGASDGYPLHMTTWNPDGSPTGQVVILHGVQSHAGWYDGLGRTLAEGGWRVDFPDRRGSGRNQTDRGHTPSARRLVRDVTEWLQAQRAEVPTRPLVLGGISWGGKLGVLAASRRPELIDGLALICPGLQPRVGVPARESLAIFAAWLLRRRHRRFAIPLADPALFTDSEAGQRFIAEDPLGLHTATADLLAASCRLDLDVIVAPGRVRTPSLLMLAGRDRIIDNTRTRRYFDRIAAPDRQIIEYPEAGHTLEFEPDPRRYALDLLAWMDQRRPPDTRNSPPSALQSV